MGMFDTVTVPCPTCGERGEFQSKSGDCKLETYTLDDAPDDVLLDVNRLAPMRCRKCDTPYGVEVSGPRRTLTVRSVVWEGHATDEPDARNMRSADDNAAGDVLIPGSSKHTDDVPFRMERVLLPTSDYHCSYLLEVFELGTGPIGTGARHAVWLHRRKEAIGYRWGKSVV